MVDYPGMERINRSSASASTLQCDICVIGSGAAGLSAALEACKMGEDVILVDGMPQIGGQAVNSVIGTIYGLYSNDSSPFRITIG